MKGFVKCQIQSFLLNDIDKPIQWELNPHDSKNMIIHYLRSSLIDSSFGHNIVDGVLCSKIGLKEFLKDSRNFWYVLLGWSSW